MVLCMFWCYCGVFCAFWVGGIRCSFLRRVVGVLDAQGSGPCNMKQIIGSIGCAPEKLTWTPQNNSGWKTTFRLKWPFLRCHFSFRGCKSWNFQSKKGVSNEIHALCSCRKLWISVIISKGKCFKITRHVHQVWTAIPPKMGASWKKP